MKLSGQCRILKIYICEDSKYKSENLAHALVRKFKEIGISGVTVIRGIAGYGKKREMHTMRILDLSCSLPLIIELVDTVENIDKAVSVANEIVNEGLMITSDVNIIKHGKE